jgi:hypothetical protein
VEAEAGGIDRGLAYLVHQPVMAGVVEGKAAIGVYLGEEAGPGTVRNSGLVGGAHLSGELLVLVRQRGPDEFGLVGEVQ